MDKETLAQRMAPISEIAAATLREPETEMAQYPTPFLASAAIYRVIKRGRYRPTGMQIGCAGEDFTVSLLNNPEGFHELAKRGGLLLDTEQKRINYLRVFLDTTRDPETRLFFLSRLDGVAWEPPQGPDGEQRLQAFREKYQGVIGPPQATPAPPWQVRVFGVLDHDLVEFVGHIAADGALRVETKVLEKQAPPYRPPA